MPRRIPPSHASASGEGPKARCRRRHRENRYALPAIFSARCAFHAQERGRQRRATTRPPALGVSYRRCIRVKESAACRAKKIAEKKTRHQPRRYMTEPRRVAAPLRSSFASRRRPQPPARVSSFPHDAAILRSPWCRPKQRASGAQAMRASVAAGEKYDALHWRRSAPP